MVILKPSPHKIFSHAYLFPREWSCEFFSKAQLKQTEEDETHPAYMERLLRQQRDQSIINEAANIKGDGKKVDIFRKLIN